MRSVADSRSPDSTAPAGCPTSVIFKGSSSASTPESKARFQKFTDSLVKGVVQEPAASEEVEVPVAWSQLPLSPSPSAGSLGEPEFPALRRYVAPSFSPLACGNTWDWNVEMPMVFWGKKVKNRFKYFAHPVVDVRVVVDFLKLRKGPDGESVYTRFNAPVEHPDGWYRLEWVGPNSFDPDEEGEFERAWHGAKMEGVFSISYHGKFRESSDPAAGDRILGEGTINPKSGV